jgi:midasin (ATPase involved in ribosome maturation)
VEKCLVLAEKGSPESKDNEVELLTAGKHFRILATMNPGGDFGKKEVKLLPRKEFGFTFFFLAQIWTYINVLCCNTFELYYG